jgi:hypothetical protein
LWTPTAHTKSDLIVRADALAGGMVLLPSVRTHDVTTQEVAPRALNRLLNDSVRSDPREPGQSRHPSAATAIEVLAVEAVTRQNRRYLPVVLLVFSATSFDDVRLSIVIDDLSSQPHDQALLDAGGADKLGISVAHPIGEPELPLHLLQQRVPYDTVRGLQRRADNPPPDATTAAGRTGTALDDDSATARAELAALTVRSVPTFEHRELLTNALDNARRRFLLVAPRVRDVVITDDLLARLENMLRRPGLVARIAYGLGQPDSEQDTSAVRRLHQLARRHNNLTVVNLTDPHPHALISDDTWINSSFDWLSFRGEPTRVYRREEGTLIRATDVVDDRYAHYAALIELADHHSR